MEIVKAENKHYSFPGFFNVLIILVSLVENFACSLSVWYIQKKVVLFSCMSAISKKQVGSPVDIKLKTWEQKPFVSIFHFVTLLSNS